MSHFVSYINLKQKRYIFGDTAPHRNKTVFPPRQLAVEVRPEITCRVPGLFPSASPYNGPVRDYKSRTGDKEDFYQDLSAGKFGIGNSE